MTDEEIIDTIKNNVRRKVAQPFCDEMAKNYSLLDRVDFSDIFSGYSYCSFKEKFQFGGKRKESYWSMGGTRAVAHEAFAEFMDSALSNQGSFQLLQKFLPTVAKVFEEILDEILK